MLDHAEIMNRCDKKRWEVGLEALTGVERVITLISWANFEIENGGVYQFYCNSAGNDAVETVWALNQIKAHQAARGLAKTNALLSASAMYPRGKAQHFDVLQSLPESTGAAFDAFDDDYYALTPDVFSMLLQYIDAHEQDLRDCGLLTP